MGFGTTGTLDESDLHAVVDGHLENERHAAIVRRLSAAPADRARVEAWQGQNDLLRSTFANVEREALPAMLDLSAKSRLQCIPANDAPLAAPLAGVESPSARRIRMAAIVATIVVVALGLGGSWILLDSNRPDRVSAQTTVSGPPPAVGLPRLPTTRIPDLSAQGLRFIGAETVSDPATILFQYQDGSERVFVSVTRASPAGEGDSSPVWTGNGFGWRSRGSAFAIAGTAAPDRLRGIAVLLQKDMALQKQKPPE